MIDHYSCFYTHVQNVFTVSVGNLPPQAEVLIKIMYVVEVAVEGELVDFCLPGSVAPWEKDPALAQQIQVGNAGPMGEQDSILIPDS